MTFPPLNTAPVAAADSVTTAENTAVTVTVLDNDHDADGDSLLVSGVSIASKGTVSTDGATVLYTPHSDASGTDHFTYTVSDGQGSSDLGTARICLSHNSNTLREICPRVSWSKPHGWKAWETSSLTHEKRGEGGFASHTGARDWRTVFGCSLLK